MSYFQITPAELRSRADWIAQLNRQFRAKEAELLELESALCSMWEGKARDTFHQTFTRDRQQMDVFRRLILQYVQALLDIAERYEQAEEHNARIAAVRSC